MRKLLYVLFGMVLSALMCFLVYYVKETRYNVFSDIKQKSAFVHNKQYDIKCVYVEGLGFEAITTNKVNCACLANTTDFPTLGEWFSLHGKVFVLANEDFCQKQTEGE